MRDKLEDSSASTNAHTLLVDSLACVVAIADIAHVLTRMASSLKIIPGTGASPNSASAKSWQTKQTLPRQEPAMVLGAQTRTSVLLGTSGWPCLRWRWDVGLQHQKPISSRLSAERGCSLAQFRASLITSTRVHGRKKSRVGGESLRVLVR